MPHDHAEGPFAAQLPLDGRDGGHAGRIEKAEDQKRAGLRRSENSRDASLGAEEYLQHGDHALLCHEAADQRRADPPVAQSQRLKERRQDAGQHGHDAVCRVFHQIEPQIEALQEPDDHRRYQDHGKCLLQEVLRLLPHQLHRASGAGQTVVGQLHYERDRLALKEHLLIEERVQDPHNDPEQIQAGHDKSALPREEGVDEERVDRQFGGAAHERRQQDRHAAVPLAGKRAGRHDRRHCTAEADQHRYDAAAGKADPAQQLIHKERDSGNVPAVLQKRQEKEHGDYDGQEA